jgi:tetratricopeptide (TPR) repeat protein
MPRTRIRTFLAATVALLMWAASAPALATVVAKQLDIAEAAFNAREWGEAARLYRLLAEENPRQGRFWYNLATAEYNLKRYREADVAYQRAVALGHNVGTSHYNRACCLALLGDAPGAIDALEQAIRNGLRNREDLLRTDTDLASLRDTPEFRARILPVATESISREDGWRMDLAYLTKRVAETHYDPFRHIPRAEWDREIARISADIPRMKDHQVIVALMQLVVRINDGHTMLGGPREGPLAFHALPLEFYDFADGLFVRAAHPDYQQLVGRRVLAIGDLPAKEALERVATTAQRDNAQQVRRMAALYLACVEVLDALRVSNGLDSVDVTVADAGGRPMRVTVKPVSLSQLGQHGQPPAGWVDMSQQATAPAPLWRRDPQRHFTLEYLEPERIVYAGFRAVLDDADETLEHFSRRVVDLAESKPLRALVIDVRTNGGGNNYLGRVFFERLQASKVVNQEGKLFVITGRETFSACQNFCNWLDQHTPARFAGEPTGSRPNFVGEGNPITLPYSGLLVNASSRYWQDSVSEDQRPWIAPDLAAEMTSDDFRANRDPALEVIVEYLDGRGTVAAGR